jgi:hypothetical protein
MRLQTRVQVRTILVSLCLTMSTQSGAAASWQCPRQPVEPCFKHHGRLSSQNGIALKIWLIGTTRVVALDNDIDVLPPLVYKYINQNSPDLSYIYGDFDICPLESDKPGHMRWVCVVGAEKLVVQDKPGVRPAFKLLSTWPTVGRGGATGAIRELP